MEENNQVQEAVEQPVQAEQKEVTIEKKKKGKGKLILLLLLVLVICSVVVYFVFFTEKEEKEPTKKPEKVSSEYRMSGNGLENFDLFFLQLENQEKNKVYSPLSIKYALAMLAEGSNGTTKDQVVALIGDYQPKKYINSEHMSFANAMFIRDSYKENIKETYTNKLKERYNAEVIYDPFANATNMNNWVSNKTFNLIKDLFQDDKVKDEDFILTNALAIDMNWNNLIQCATGSKLKCMRYSVNYKHENYNDYVGRIENDRYESLDFENIDAKSVEVAASLNNYNIVKELGEENIRKTVGDGYDEYIAKGGEDCGLSKDEFLDKYMKELDSNYKQVDVSTDFLIHEDNDVKVFAKDLQEYDGTTLQYVGIMPKKQALKDYIKEVNAKKLSDIINNLKEIKLENFEDGKVTHIKGKIPLFNYSDQLDLITDLQELGVKDVFDINKADLSEMLEENSKAYISDASHKATIEFSNEGIKAAAATQMGGEGAAACPLYEYKYDVPVNEIDLNFNKPYMYLIRDKETGEVWFVGSVYEPTAN